MKTAQIHTVEAILAPLEFFEIRLMCDFEAFKGKIDEFITNYYSTSPTPRPPDYQLPLLPLVVASPMTVFGGHGMKRGGFKIVVSDNPAASMSRKNLKDFGFGLATWLVAESLKGELKAFATDGQDAWWISRHRTSSTPS